MNAQSKVLDGAVRRALVGKGSHVETNTVFGTLDWKTAGRAPLGSPHTLFQLLNHMIFWQEWVIHWLDGETPPTPRHAGGGWPGAAAPADRQEWERTVRRFRRGLGKLDRQARLAALLSRRRGKTPLEMLQTIGAHNSYHAGQAVLLRQMLGKWPPRSGGVTW